MTSKQVTHYINLVHRRTFILAHAGRDWKPEYAQEMEEINKELDRLRPLVDEEHKNRCEKEKRGVEK